MESCHAAEPKDSLQMSTDCDYETLETVACAVISDCNAEVCLRGLAFSVFRQVRGNSVHACVLIIAFTCNNCVRLEALLIRFEKVKLWS